MTYRGKTTLVTTIIVAIFLFVFFGFYLGFQNAYNFIGTFSPFIPFIVAGIIMWVLGISEKKWGSFLFTFITLILLFLSLKK